MNAKTGSCSVLPSAVFRISRQCLVLPEGLLRERCQLLPSYLDTINGDLSKTHHSRGNVSGFLARLVLIASSQMLMKICLKCSVIPTSL